MNTRKTTKGRLGPQARPSQGAAAPPASESDPLIGTPAPGLSVVASDGTSIRLLDFNGQKLAVFTYPRADTPTCTREAVDFTQLTGAFAAAGTALLGVSDDPPRKQRRFADKHALTVPLASDEGRELIRAFGAWGEKSMYGRTFEGVLRTTVLIGADGRIAHVWRNVRVDGHAAAVLEAARAANVKSKTPLET